jgi:hypothetical protein
MDSNLSQRRQGLEEKIPDIKKTLTMVEYLRERRVSITSLSEYSSRISSGNPMSTDGTSRGVKVKPIHSTIKLMT